MKVLAKHLQAIQYARLYYEKKYTQEEIAELLDVSRPAVSRGLKLAHEIGAVQMRVINPFSHFFNLSQAIEERFQLKKVEIAPVVDDSTESKKRQMGYVAASVLSTMIVNGSLVAVAWGSTIAEIVAATAAMQNEKVSAKFVQMLGAIGSRVAPEHINEVTRGLAQVLGADWLYLPAPAIVDNEHTRMLFMREGTVSEVLHMCRKADIAVVGIGAIDEQNGAVTLGHMTAHEMAQMRAGGAAGEICYRFFDRKGKPCPSGLDGRIIGIDLESLRSIPIRIGVAGGQNKLEAILGALLGGYINVLITDEITATELLQYDLAVP